MMDSVLYWYFVVQQDTKKCRVKYFVIYVEGGAHAPFFWCCLR